MTDTASMEPRPVEGKKSLPVRFWRLLVRTWRRPGLAAWVSALGLLGLVQGALQGWSLRNYGVPSEAYFGLMKFGLAVAFATMLLFLPFILLGRRLLPAWRRGDRETATWSLTLPPVWALIAWMLADRLAVAVKASEAFALWLPIGAAVAIAVATHYLWAPRPLTRRVLPTVMALTCVGVMLLPTPHGGPGPAPDAGGAPAPKPAAAPADSPDVVLITVDTLRADRLGPWGGTLTPALDQLAAEGVVCKRALAGAPWTGPSVASLVTGVPSVRHGAGRIEDPGQNFQRTPLAGRFVTVAERFAAAGYRTRAISASSQVGPWSGMDQGFQEFKSAGDGAGAVAFLRGLPLTRLIVSFIPPEKIGDPRAAALTSQALKWLDEKSERPLFLWVHYNDPHVPLSDDPSRLVPTQEQDPLAPPEVLADGSIVGKDFNATGQVRGGRWWLHPQDRHRIEEYYDRAVRYADEQMVPLLDALRERSKERRVILAFTADHGEELWDHGHYEHGHDYHSEITRVPLLFWGPGTVAAGRSADDVVGLVDVAPTLLDLAGVAPLPLGAPDEGRSLAPLLREGPPDTVTPQPRFCGGNLYDLPAELVEDGPWRAILRANHKLELYDVRNDSGEEWNVAGQHPAVAAAYRKMLEPRLAAFLGAEQGQKTELTPEQIGALKSLGYVQ